MSAVASSLLPRYQFADLTLDLGQRRVLRGQDTIELGKLTFELLRVLAESSPNVVAKDELAEKVWGGRSVSPETITQRVMMLRHALSDDAEHPRYVEVVRGHGCRLIPQVRVGATNSGHPRFIPRRSGAAAGLVVAILAIVGLSWKYLAIPESTTMPSVAVLPLENLSADPDHAYFAAGMHTEIISRLGNIQNLVVISRPAMLQYSNSDQSIREIAAELNVQAVMVGSVQFDGERVRINVDLIDPDTAENLWSDLYERNLSDSFGIQSDIAMNIANALAAQLSVVEQEAIEKLPTDSPEAYALFLNAITTQDSDRAITILDEAIMADSRFALAYAAKAGIAAWMITGFSTASSDADWAHIGIRNATLALELIASPAVVYES